MPGRIGPDSMTCWGGGNTQSCVPVSGQGSGDQAGDEDGDGCGDTVGCACGAGAAAGTEVGGVASHPISMANDATVVAVRIAMLFTAVSSHTSTEWFHGGVVRLKGRKPGTKMVFAYFELAASAARSRSA
jgi:hypothetical protein